MSERAASGQNIGSIIFLSAFRFFLPIFYSENPILLTPLQSKLGGFFQHRVKPFLFKYKEAKNKRVAS